MLLNWWEGYFSNSHLIERLDLGLEEDSEEVMRSDRGSVAQVIILWIWPFKLIGAIWETVAILHVSPILNGELVG